MVISYLRLLSAFSSGEVAFWTVQPGGGHKLSYVLKAKGPSPVTAMGLSSCGSSAVLGDGAGVVRLWDIERLVTVPGPTTEEGLHSVEFGGSSNVVCATSSQVILWNLGGEDVIPLARSSFMTKASVSSSGNLVVAGSRSGCLKVWDVRARKLIISEAEDKTSNSAVTALAFSSQSDQVASGYSDGTVGVWDISGRWRRLESTQSPVHSLTFSRCGSKLLAGGLGLLSTIHLQDGTRHTETVPLEAWHHAPVQSLAVQSTSGSVLLASAEPSLKVAELYFDPVHPGTWPQQDIAGPTVATQASAAPGVSDPHLLTGSTTPQLFRTRSSIKTEPAKTAPNSASLPPSMSAPTIPNLGGRKPAPQTLINTGPRPDVHSTWPPPKATSPLNAAESTTTEPLLLNPTTDHATWPLRSSSQSLAKQEADLGQSQGCGDVQNVKLQPEVGMSFSNVDDAKDFVELFSLQQKMAFNISTNGGVGGALVFTCRHGKKRPSKSTGERVVQKTIKKGCPAFIRLYIRASGVTVLKQFNLDHPNHACSDSIYQQDTTKVDDRARAIIKQMLDGNSKINNIRMALAAQGIKLSRNQVRYEVRQILGAPMDEEKLAELLRVVEEEGGDVKILRFPDGMVRVLSITTAKMKKAYLGADPTVVQIDTTFGVEKAGYKLNTVVYRNPVTGKGEVARISFMADETALSYEFALSGFKAITRKDPAVILIDKVGSSKYLALILIEPIEFKMV